MKVLAFLIAVVIALGALWLAGEQHRANCLTAGRAHCSVLPWQSGDATGKGFDFRSAH